MILTIGTSLALARTMIFDRLTIDTVNRATEVLVASAGKSTNVARAAHTLGETVLATGTIGGNTGADLAAELTHAGIPHDFVHTAAPTRVCITVVDRAAATATELIEETGPVTDEESERLWEKLLDLVPQARVIVMSGALAPKVPQGFYAMICRLARDLAIPAIVDARGPELLATLAERPLLVKPNRAELETSIGRSIGDQTDLLSAMRDLTTRGAHSVAVTAGKDAVYFCVKDRAWRLTPPRVQVVSAIGSGDAFAAGFAVGVVRGLEPIECARLGVACGSANALTSRAGFVTRADIDRLLPQVTIEPI